VGYHLQVFLEGQSARAEEVDNFGSSWYVILALAGVGR
jgi:hypothetical protein